MEVNPTEGYQKKVAINYSSMEELLNRQEHITKTLQNYLDRTEEQYISDTQITVGEDKFTLTFTLDILEK